MEISVKKLEEFIGEILDYSKNKRLVVQREAISLKDLCQEVSENLKFIDGYQHIKFDLDQLDNITINSDKARLKIIFNNLLSNAIKFRKKTDLSLIKIISFNRDNFVIIEVQDNGQGIRAELQSRIFEMFFRASENEKGSGLGLYIAKEAAEKINGTISVLSEYGTGSTFIIKLPIQ
jgi:Signal transduction histidine kinase